MTRPDEIGLKTRGNRDGHMATRNIVTRGPTESSYIKFELTVNCLLLPAREPLYKNIFLCT